MKKRPEAWRGLTRSGYTWHAVREKFGWITYCGHKLKRPAREWGVIECKRCLNEMNVPTKE